MTVSLRGNLGVVRAEHYTSRTLRQAPPASPASVAPGDNPGNTGYPAPPALGRGLMQARLPLPPTRPLFGPTTLQNIRPSLSGVSALPQASLHGDLFVNANAYLAPSVFVPVAIGSGAAATSEPVGVETLSLPYGFLGLAILPPVNGIYNIGLAYLSASSFGLFGVQSHPNVVSHTLIGTFGNGFASLGISTYKYSPTLLHSLSGLLAGWRDYIGFGLQSIWINRATGALTLIGGQIGIQARRDVSDLGPVTGALAGSLAEYHHFWRTKSLRRFELRKRFGQSLSLRGAIGSIFLAYMLRIDIGRSREVVYRTIDTPENTQKLVHERPGVGRYLREKGRALGILRDPIRVPDLSKPENISVGDQITVTRTGTFVLAGLIGNLSIWGTAQFSYRGDVEVDVRKIHPTVMEVSVTPVRSLAANAFCVQPLSPHAGVRIADVKVTRHVLLYDISIPAAKEAYLKAIRGKVPEEFSNQKVTALDQGDAMSQLIQGAQKKLPSGVHYSFVHAMNARVYDGGGGFKFLVIPREALPKNWEVGLTMHQQYGHETQVVVDGKEIVRSDNRTVSRNSERLFFGLKTFQVSALQRWTQPLGLPPQFNELTVQATWGDTNVQRGGFNRRLVRRLNRYFAMKVPKAMLSGAHEDRQMQVSRQVGPQAMAQLGSIAHSPYNPGDLQTAYAARAGHINHGSVRRLTAGLNANYSERYKVSLLQRFVQRHGLRGFAAVHHLLDGEANSLLLRTASSTYEKAINGAAQLALKYLNPVGALDTGKMIAKRYKEVGAGLQAVQKAQRQVEDDPLLTDPTRNSLRLGLHDAESKLHPLLVLTDDAEQRLRGALHGHLRRRTWQRRALLALQPKSCAAADAQALAQQASMCPVDAQTVANARDAVRLRLSALYDMGYLLPEAQRHAEVRELQAALNALPQ